MNPTARSSIPLSRRIRARGIPPGLLGDGSGGHSGGDDDQHDDDDDDSSGDDSHGHSGGPVFGLGFIPDRPDERDHDSTALDTAAPASVVPAKRQRGSGTRTVDLSKSGLFGPVEIQGAMQTCTSHVVTAMAEYHLLRGRRKRAALSRLFLYKVAREILGLRGDAGCTLRETFKALARYGCLDESRWPYDRKLLERNPRIGWLEEARQFRVASYCRLDAYNADGAATLAHVLRALDRGYPVGFGFTIYSSIDAFGRDAVIPLPEATPDARVIGAHAVLAVGYRLGPEKGGGALRIRNSWGEKWGENGYGWLPFDYVKRQLACDFWAMYRAR